ncbi:MAG: hypothetical protein JWM90_2240 [Thermoleophilia bacterium]|nr:hypothetical protein [Thermoleophilia bacterium]
MGGGAQNSVGTVLRGWLVIAAVALLAVAMPPAASAMDTVTTIETPGCAGAVTWRIGYQLYWGDTDGRTLDRTALDSVLAATRDFAGRVGTGSECGIRVAIDVYDMQDAMWQQPIGRFPAANPERDSFRELHEYDVLFLRYPETGLETYLGATNYQEAWFPTTAPGNGAPWVSLLTHEWLHDVVNHYPASTLGWPDGDVHGRCNHPAYCGAGSLGEMAYYADMTRGRVQRADGTHAGMLPGEYAAAGTPAHPMPKPTATTPPHITGTGRPGETLTCLPGTWSNSPTTFAYNWYRPSTGAFVPGATSPTYVPSRDDGFTIGCQVRAISPSGAGSYFVYLTLDLGPKPEMVTAPTITGTGRPGDELTCNPGTWTNDPTRFTYGWYRVSTGAWILGADASRYIPTSDDGFTLGCRVVAVNTNGSTSTWAYRELDLGPKPEPIVLPSISGTGRPGDELTCNTGTWRNDPTTITVHWYSASTGAYIPDATSITYTPSLADGSYVGCYVRAASSAGVTKKVAYKTLYTSFTALSSMRVTGTGAIGSTMQCDPGTYTFNPSTTYRWRYWSSLTGAVDVAEPNGPTYVPMSTSATHLECEVTATAQGFTIVRSARIALIRAPAAIAPPTIAGTTMVGQRLTATSQSWGTGASITRRWERCSAPGLCSAIPDADESSYLLTSDDLGTTTRFITSASNAAGESTATSAETTIVAAAPTSTTTSDSPTTDGSTPTTTTGTITSPPLPPAPPSTTQPHGTNPTSAQPDVSRPAGVVPTMRRDVYAGSAGPDHIRLLDGNDLARGGSGNDSLFGQGGNDQLFGGAGKDRLFGGVGNDLLDGGPGADLLSGEAGRDRIIARDGVRDVIRCGSGFDTVIADRRDVVSRDCERVQRR